MRPVPTSSTTRSGIAAGQPQTRSLTVNIALLTHSNKEFIRPSQRLEPAHASDALSMWQAAYPGSAMLNSRASYPRSCGTRCSMLDAGRWRNIGEPAGRQKMQKNYPQMKQIHPEDYSCRSASSTMQKVASCGKPKSEIRELLLGGWKFRIPKSELLIRSSEL